jgi:hypothetical protein
MRLAKFFALAILASGVSCLSQNAPKAADKERSAPTNPPISISVDFPVTPIRLGAQEITVNITATNVTDRDIWFELGRDKNGIYKSFKIVLMNDGAEVQTTFFHRKITGRQRPDDPLEVESESLFPVVYPPGRMFVDMIDLKRLYEISEPGVYTLDVSRFDEQSKATIRSKTVTLKIEP